MMRAFIWIRTHRYCLAGLYLFVFLAGFFLLETAAPEPKLYIHCALDDYIPFNEWFVLPYFLWYLWVPAWMLYFMLCDRETYLELCFVMFAGATLCLFIYALWPNGLRLRQEITSTNICARLVGLLRSVDPPCNVCPSIHVSSTTAVHMAVVEAKRFAGNRRIKHLSRAVTLLICVSTLFIRQHSVIDVLFGWGLSLAMAFVWEMKDVRFQEEEEDV